MHDGQHPAIVEPKVWDAIQLDLQQSSRKQRGKSTDGKGSRNGSISGNANGPNRKTDQSLLIGKLFDENGARLTPSHSSKGKRRYRYYISHHLIKGASGKSGSDTLPMDSNPPDGSEQSGIIGTKKNQLHVLNNWRLPAKPLEDAVLSAISNHLQINKGALLSAEASATDLQHLTTHLDKWLNGEASQQGQSVSHTTHINHLNEGELIERIDLAPGLMKITMNKSALADTLQCQADHLDEHVLHISAPFQMKKRGVETKFIMGDGSARPDQTLIRNIAIAHHIMNDLKSGQSMERIASRFGLTEQHASELLKLAFFAPDLVTKILQGKHPIKSSNHHSQLSGMSSAITYPAYVLEGQ